MPRTDGKKAPQVKAKLVKSATAAIARAVQDDLTRCVRLRFRLKMQTNFLLPIINHSTYAINFLVFYLHLAIGIGVDAAVVFMW